jgi:GNAT superfamily N-acetyltransferase
VPVLRQFRLHRPTPDDWAASRDIRIRAVTDTPIAYLETLDEVLAVDETGWRERVAKNVHDGATQVVAVDGGGRWIGSAVCFLSDGEPGYLPDAQPGPTRANLVGVFVDPDWRGDAGVLDALLGEITRWVRTKQLSELYLHVGEPNGRARRSYEKRGFRTTGRVVEVPQQPGIGEIEMVLAL